MVQITDSVAAQWGKMRAMHGLLTAVVASVAVHGGGGAPSPAVSGR